MSKNKAIITKKQREMKKRERKINKEIKKKSRKSDKEMQKESGDDVSIESPIEANP